MRRQISSMAAALFIAASGLSFAAESKRVTPIVQVVRDNAASVVNVCSVGSGVIVDKDGLVITNAHVVSMATNILVTLSDGTKLEGQVVFQDPAQDLAIIKVIPEKPLREVTLGTTDDLMTGETAVAIGNSLGLENSVTAGVVSGKDRALYVNGNEPFMKGLLQTDAPINPGNSGGALFNLDGQLIGINVAVVQSAQGLGFAIPVEKVKEIKKVYDEKKSTLPTFGPGTKYNHAQTPSKLYQNGDPFLEMARMFSKALGGGIGAPRSEAMPFSAPDFDVDETDDGYLITLDIADFDKDSVKATLRNGTLTVTAEYREEEEKNLAGGAMKSQRFGTFMRSIPLPVDADAKTFTSQVKGDELEMRLRAKK